MKRNQMSWVAAMALGLTILLTACGAGGQPQAGESKAPAPRVEPTAPAPGGGSPGAGASAPVEKPEAAPTQGLPAMPGDRAALMAALGESNLLTYRIAVANAPKGADKTQFLDQMLGENGYPGKNELLLLVFPNDNYDIRFAMGAMLFEKKVSVQSMLDLVRYHYLPKARTGDPAGGLTDLVRAVNQEVK